MTGQEQRIKISELPTSVSFSGLWTLGYQIVDGKKTSVKISLDEIHMAYTNVVAATQAANTAAGNANTAVGHAKEAATKAAEAAEKANTAAGNADTAAKSANTAAERVDTAIRQAAEATTKAVEATTKATTATSNANHATEAANTAAGNATTAAGNATEATTKATEATKKAETATQNAATATGNANTAADRANRAAETAEGVISGLQPDWNVIDPVNKNYIKNKPEIPTLEAIPDENTLSYVNTDGTTINFRIGDEVRVAEEGEYVFYRLYDLAGGKASWKESGSGTALPGNVYLTGANYYNESVRTIKQGYLSNE